VKQYELDWMTSDGVPIHCQGWQPDADPRAVVCLVHGLGEHIGRYTHVAAAFARAGIALHGSDLRGHGRSGGPRGHSPSHEALLDDIDLLVNEAIALYGKIPWFLYGHSLGGNLALNYALDRLDGRQEHASLCAGIVATGPWLRLSMTPPTSKLLLGRIMNRILPTFVQASGLDVTALSHDPQVVRDYRADPLVHDRISAGLAMALFDAGERALARAAEFRHPLLLMHGGADRITSNQASQDFARRVTGDCTFRSWDGLYHEIHNEPEKSEVLRFTVDWLTNHLPS
jgi:alpha-beta hydrolase superfamily lysophospholipase